MSDPFARALGWPTPARETPKPDLADDLRRMLRERRDRQQAARKRGEARHG